MIRLSFDKHLLRALGALSLLSAVACGGGGGGGGGGSQEPATTSGGETIQTAGGQVVTQAAHSKWTRAVERFNALEASRGPWNRNNCSEVRGLFEAANSEQRSRFVEAIYMQGVIAERCGETSDARRFYTRALELAQNGNYCPARVGLGVLDYDAGNTAAAKAAFNQAIEAAPETCVSGYVSLAVVQASEGPAHEQEAIDNLRRALAIQSNYMPAFNQLALVFYRQGVRTRDASKWDLAEIVCRQAQLIQANYGPVYNTWGLIKLARGNINEALRLFEAAITHDPTIFEAQMNFAQLNFQFRGYEAAERAFRAATQLRERHYEATLGLGSALRGLNRTDEAQQMYELAIQIDGRRAEAYYNLGLLYQDYRSGEPNDLNRATSYYREFLQRAANVSSLAETVTELNRRCQIEQQPRGRRRRPAATGRNACRPGRIQQIEITINALREAEEMQAEAARMEAEAARLEREAAAQGQ